MSKARSLAVTLAVALTIPGQPHALACGYHGGIGDSFSAQHPKSLKVAFAIRDAVDAGQLPASVLAPVQTGNEFYWRAAQRLAHLQEAVAGAGAHVDSLAAVSVLLIDSRLWARMIPQASGYALDLHTKGPEPGDVVLLTSDTILAAVVDGDVSAEAALGLKVIQVDGTQPAVDVVRNRLSAAFANSGGMAAPVHPLSFLPAKQKN